MPACKSDRFEWTDERIADLVRLDAEGRTGGEISAYFNHRPSRNAVIGKLFCLNKGKDKPPRQDRQREAARIEAKLKSRAAETARTTQKRMNIVVHAKRAEPKEAGPGAGRSDNSYIALQSGLWKSANKPGVEVRESEPDAFDKMTARPWEERRDGECKWPFGPPEATLSCCRPVARSGYCLKHADLAFLKRTRTQSQADAKLMAFILKRVA
jgi:hypothetical protein